MRKDDRSSEKRKESMCSDGSAGPESLDGAGARSTEKLDISSWHYATGWSREKLSGRDIRSQGTLEHGGVSSRVVKDSYPWLSLGLGPLGRGIEDCSNPRDSALTEIIRWTGSLHLPPSPLS